MLHKAALVLVVALVMLPLCAHAQAPKVASESGRVFAFMPHFVFDFERGVFFNRIRGKSYILSDCSTVDTICFKSSEFNVSFPRECEAREAYFDNSDGSLRSVNRGRYRYEEEFRLLVDDSHPDFGFLIGKNGVAYVLYNPLTPVSDVANEAALARALNGSIEDFNLGQLLSAIRLGRCET